jgi:peptidyl-prolyl cis-trans isomerase SurA
MKKFLWLFVLVAGTGAVSAQTLFTYGKSAVSRQEFLRAYNKNKIPADNARQSIEDYLDLYIRFKLKVQASYDMKLDTLEQLSLDMQNFRSQIEGSYLNDEKAIERLLDEAIVRSQRDIHLLHFSVPLSNKVDPADTVKAHRAIEEAREDLLKGKTDYDEMVDEISAEHFKLKGTDLGFITALQLPYTFEQVAYSLKPGEVSRIIRTRSGLHVFKSIGERKSPGRWRVAQILLAVPPDVTGAGLKKLEQFADSLYGALKQGADFATMAKKYSDDKLTYLTGGEMPEFGTGKYELPFETKVFALEKDGDIAPPIFTGYGFHIVKRLQVRPTPSDRSDEAFVYNLRQQLLKDSRINGPRDNFIKGVHAKTGFRRNPAVKEEALFRYADSVAETKTVGKYPINGQTIFSFSKLAVKGSDWLNFVKDYRLNPDVYKGESNRELLDKYISTTTMEYYRNHLEEYDEDFRFQLQEFKEGNMLFEAMERNVWSKATADSVGLRRYYSDKQAKYQWGESADVVLFNATDRQTADAAVKELGQGKGWRLIAAEREANIQADSGRYEQSQLQLPVGTTTRPGLVTAPASTGNDNTATFLQVIRTYPAGGQRSFEEAKGLVINDYQGYLEERWIAELKKKYPVKVNEPVWQAVKKQP